MTLRDARNAGWLITVFLVMAVGCQQPATISVVDDTKLRTVGILYGQFRAANHGDPPETIEAFRQFIAARKQTNLPADVSNAEQLLTSPRDNQPYVIAVGSDALAGAKCPDGNPLIAFEQEGKDGRRRVASSMGVWEVSGEEFEKLTGNAS